MGNYNWKAHYAVQLTEQEHSDAFCTYEIDAKAGTGKVTSCTVFPGIQAVYNDLKISHCGRTVPRKEEIVEINYCIEGRYECEVNNQYCFFASPGDLSVGIVGRKEAAGGFPTGHFTGLTLFVELSTAKERNDLILQEMGIDLDMVQLMAIQEPRRFYIRGRKDVDDVCRQMVSAVTGKRISILKLRTLELLMLIDDSEFVCCNNKPVYISRKNAQLAKDVRTLITNDLSCRMTLRHLSEELNASQTAIKNAFKSVYGESIREHLKSIRLQEAQRLLQDTDLPVSEVAEMVGYSNPGHFSVAFRERYALTPGNYKRAVRSQR